MLNQFSRTELLIKEDGIQKLQKAKVAIFGIGGVGSFAVEGLVRSGIGNFILVDDDKICLTNLNRQIIATRKTIGKYKVDVMKERMLDIISQIEKANYEVISTLSKGCVGGLEITTGMTKFKYTLISNTNFCSVLKLNIQNLEDEHLKMLLINLNIILN